MLAWIAHNNLTLWGAGKSGVLSVGYDIGQGLPLFGRSITALHRKDTVSHEHRVFYFGRYIYFVFVSSRFILPRPDSDVTKKVEM